MPLCSKGERERSPTPLSPVSPSKLNLWPGPGGKAQVQKPQGYVAEESPMRAKPGVGALLLQESPRTPSPGPRCHKPGSPLTPGSPLSPKSGASAGAGWSDLAAQYEAHMRSEALEERERKGLHARLEVLEWWWRPRAAAEAAA